MKILVPRLTLAWMIGSATVAACGSFGSGTPSTTTPDAAVARDAEVELDASGGGDGGNPSSSITLVGKAIEPLQSGITSIRLTHPTAARPGDLLIACTTSDSLQEVVPPVGWTSERKGVGFNVWTMTFSHVVEANEPSAHIFSIPSVVEGMGVLLAYRGVAAAPNHFVNSRISATRTKTDGIDVDVSDLARVDGRLLLIGVTAGAPGLAWSVTPTLTSVASSGRIAVWEQPVPSSANMLRLSDGNTSGDDRPITAFLAVLKPE